MEGEGGREIEGLWKVRKLKGGGGKEKVLFVFCTGVVALCICQNIECLTGQIQLRHS